MSRQNEALQDKRRFNIFRRWARSGAGQGELAGRAGMHELARKWGFPIGLSGVLLAIALGLAS